MEFPTEEEARTAHIAVVENSNFDGAEARGASDWITLGSYLSEFGGAPWCEFDAIYCFERALSALGDTPPSARQLADALFGYGASIADDGGGPRDPVLFEAIEKLEQAILIYQQLDDQVAVLNARFQLGYALSEIIGQERHSSAERAVRELKDVRAAFRHGDDRVFRANVDSVLGSAYLDLVDGDPRENLNQAEAAFRRSLHVFSRFKNDDGIAQGYLNLAVVYNERNNLGDEGATLKAIIYARKALRHTTGNFPIDTLSSVFSNLARALTDSGGREWAAKARKAEMLLSDGISMSEAENSLGGFAMRLNRARLVFDLCQYLDADRMGDVRADLAASEGKFDPLETTQWWLEWHELQALWFTANGDFDAAANIAEKVVEHTETIIESTPALSERMHLLNLVGMIADLGILGHLEVGGPAFGLKFVRRVYGKLLGFDTKSQEQPSGVAEIYLLNTVAKDWADVLVAADGHCDRYPLEGAGREFWAKSIEKLETGFFAGMDAFARHRSPQMLARALEEWIGQISGALGPVLFDLREEGRAGVVVYAFGEWCTVPMAALQMPGQDGERKQLIDHMTVTFGPDQYLPHPIETDKVLHIVDKSLGEASPEKDMLKELMHKRIECSSLAEVQRHLSCSAAYDVIHFTTHGAHDFDYLEGAGILCADNEVLTARWVFENASLQGGPLVCLAACQTGLSDFSNLPHETFGLPSAFISAGASAVVSTQWPVDDVASRLLLWHFYQEVSKGQSLDAALRNAQLWLRDAEQQDLDAVSSGQVRFSKQGAGRLTGGRCPFADPFFWAGFQLHRA